MKDWTAISGRLPVTTEEDQDIQETDGEPETAEDSALRQGADHPEGIRDSKDREE